VRYADPEHGGEDSGGGFAGPPPAQGDSGRERRASPSTNQTPADYSQAQVSLYQRLVAPAEVLA